MLYGFARCVAIMPRFVRYYILEEIIYFILQYVVRYRRKVVLTNLRNAFPEKSDKEISKIAARCNRNLAEQMINTLSVAGISPERLKRYQTVVNIEEYRKAVAGRDVILLAGHYGSWEYHTSVAQHAPEQMIMSIYHPLNNSVMDDGGTGLGGVTDITTYLSGAEDCYWSITVKDNYSGVSKTINVGIFSNNQSVALSQGEILI
jgi:KDO2-lipid IV(A) lauroyltransferase